MTSIRGHGPGPARRPDSAGTQRTPEPAAPESSPPKRTGGLAAFSKDSVVTGKRPAEGAGDGAPTPPTSADLSALDAAARGHFDAATSVGNLYRELSAKVADVARLAESGTAEELRHATKDLQEMNQSFNLQYLQLQQKMQQESRQYTLISNIMKTKHDTAKSAMQNIR
jgi:hypothetical protein